MLNKRAAGEGISWVAGLIAILMIIVFSIIAYKIGSIGEKKPITLDLLYNDYNSEIQRVGAYVISSDFNSSEKGKLLFSFYNDAQDAGVGNAVHLPTFYIPQNYYYMARVNLQYQPLDFILNFYLSSYHSPGKYLSFKLTKVKNEK